MGPPESIVAPWPDLSRPLNHVLDADIVYVRDFAHADSLSDEQLKHLALIAHHCYSSFDLALRCVMLLEQRQVLETGSQQRYWQILGPNSSGHGPARR